MTTAAPARWTEPQTDEGKLADQWWRLNNLYSVVDEAGRAVRFRPRPVQTDFYWRMWYLNLILKSRQHGFSTFLLLIALDNCLFRTNYHAHIIAHTREDSEKLFEEKIRWPLRQLHQEFPELGAISDTVEDNARVLKFPAGSQLSCGSSMRGGTLQWLHISEHGKICAKFPDKAKEIRTGSLNTVHPGQMITIESTAEGRQGDFYEFATRAQKRAEAKAPLSQLDFRFFFYAWHQDAKNVLDPRGVVIPIELADYFRDIGKREGIRLTPGQKAWYAARYATQRDLMFREHPTTAEEAFQGATEGTYYGKLMLQARRQGRIVPNLPFDVSRPVHTAWDLGKNDECAIWWFQWSAREGVYKWIRYEEGDSESLAYWYSRLDEVRGEHGFAYGAHYLPHDVEHTELSLAKGVVRRDILEELGMTNIVVVERVPSVIHGIEAAKHLIPISVFSEAGCERGIAHLENYRREWDERTESHKDTPRHDQASNGADAYRQAAQELFYETAYEESRESRRGRKKKRSWRAA